MNVNGGSVYGASAGGNVTGNGDDADVGGLVGNNGYESNIEFSSASGNVTGKGSPADVGGLVGYNDGVIEDSAYTGAKVTGVYNVGGLVGYNDTDGAVSNSTSTVSPPLPLCGGPTTCP